MMSPFEAWEQIHDALTKIEAEKAAWDQGSCRSVGGSGRQAALDIRVHTARIARQRDRLQQAHRAMVFHGTVADEIASFLKDREVSEGSSHG